MSAGFDPGLGGGGGAPPVPGGGGGRGTPAYNAALFKDPALQLATLLDLLGLGSPSAQHSYAGSTIADTYGQLLPAWLKTQGLGGQNVLDNVGGLIGDFAHRVAAPGGFGALAADANKAVGQFVGNPGLTGSLDDQDIAATLKGFQQLAGLGLNPILQQARNNSASDALGQFLRQLGATWQQGGDQAAGAFKYLPFIQGDPRFKWLAGGGQ